MTPTETKTDAPDTPKVPFWLGSRSLLFLTVGLALAIPTLLLSGLINLILGREMEERSIAVNNMEVSIAARAVQEHFDGLMRYTESFATRKKFSEFVEQRDAANARPHLQALVEQNLKVDRVILTDPKGVLWCDYPPDPSVMGKDFSQRDWFQGASKTRKVYVSEIYQRAALGSPYVVAIASAVQNSQQQTTGYLVVQHRIESLTSWLRQIDPAAHIELLLADHHDRLAAGFERGKTFTLPPALREEFTKQRGFLRAPSPIQGELCLISYSRIEPIDWTILSTRPIAALQKPIRQFQHATFALASICFIVILVLAFRFLDAMRSFQLMLRQKNEELANVNAELEQFAYVASHDLQEPLRAISGCTQMLADRLGDKLDSAGKDLVLHTNEGCVRMQTLISDLLQYARITTRGLPFTPTATDQLVEEALSNLSVAIAESHAVVSKDVLPTVMGDASQLRQVFQNLISNAIKYHGNRAPQVQIGAIQREGEWEFSVRDNGIGIEPQYFDRIFVIFQRLHTRDEYTGTGIGLALVKKIIERHGGRIWVESVPGQESTFRFTLPERKPTA